MVKAIKNKIIFLSKEITKLESKHSEHIIRLDNNNGNRYVKGIIFSIGPEVRDSDLKIGATVLFQEWKGMEVEFDNVKYTMIDEDDVDLLVNSLD